MVTERVTSTFSPSAQLDFAKLRATSPGRGFLEDSRLTVMAGGTIPGAVGSVGSAPGSRNRRRKPD
jgi:hypothetical protein